MKACSHCGRIMGDKAVRRHEKVCEKNPAFSQDKEGSIPEKQEEVEIQEEVEAPEEAEDQTIEAPESEPTPASQPPAPPSFPAAMCPDTLILHENRQMFFQVAGRRIEGKIYIEEVKMLR